MTRFVLDGSMTMSWCFADESDDSSAEVLRRLDEDEAVVPSIWPLEVANVLLVGERKRRIKAADSEAFVTDLAQLSIHVEPEDPRRILDVVLPLARKHQLTSYDASYLDLAMRASLPLASRDEPLRRAARAEGVVLLNP